MPHPIEVELLVYKFIDNYQKVFHVSDEDMPGREHAFISGMHIACMGLHTITEIAQTKQEAEENIKQFIDVIKKIYNEATDENTQL